MAFMSIEEALKKQAEKEGGIDLERFRVGIAQPSKRKTIIFVTPKKEKPSKKEIAAKAVRSAAIGGAMAGGLPWAVLGLGGGQRWRVPFWGGKKLKDELIQEARAKALSAVAPEKAAETAGREIEQIFKKQRFLRRLALGGALAGVGSAVYGPVKDWWKDRQKKMHTPKVKTSAKTAALNSQNVGKFVQVSTPSILGAPGKDIKQTSVDPNRSVKEVLKTQAVRELTPSVEIP